MNVPITKKMPANCCSARLNLWPGHGAVTAFQMILNSPPCLMILIISCHPETATARLPIAGDNRHSDFFNGPESFTPDDRYLLGKPRSWAISLLQPALIRSAFSLPAGPVWRWPNGWIQAARRWISGMWISGGCTRSRQTVIICLPG